MNKTLKRTILIILSAVVLFLFALIAFFITMSDEIVSTDKKTFNTNTIMLTHETKKGDKIETPLTVSSKPMGDDLYLINVLFDNGSDSEHYDVKYGRFKISIDNNVETPMMFYSCSDGLNYRIPNVRYGDGNTQTLECDSDDGYLNLEMLLSGEEAKNLKFDVNYSIVGNGTYSINKFYNLKESFDLSDFV